MGGTADSTLREATTLWCARAEAALATSPAEPLESAEHAREGVLLRRRWDRTDPGAALRRQLLRLLPAVQTAAQHRVTEIVDHARRPNAELVRLVVRQLDEDDRYLVALLNDYDHAPEAVAFAVECFRDDLHWLGTQVATLDGSRGVDFLGRVLLEEEALEHEMEAWQREVPGAASHRAPPAAADSESARPSNQPADGSQASSKDRIASMRESLRRAVRQLRATALARQVQSLADQPESEDHEGWYGIWRAASRLQMRLDPELMETAAAEGPPGETSGLQAAHAEESVKG
ncbi:MAG: hypothetical protein ACYTG0_11835, partial [Planctomycetota bacterium]